MLIVLILSRPFLISWTTSAVFLPITNVWETVPKFPLLSGEQTILLDFETVSAPELGGIIIGSSQNQEFPPIWGFSIDIFITLK